MPLRKIQTWPQAIVAVAGLVAVGGIIVALVLAGWDAQAIIGFAILAASVATGQFVQARKAAQIDAKTDQQTDMLHRVVGQTNGKTDEELDEIADRAAVRVIAAYKRGELTR